MKWPLKSVKVDVADTDGNSVWLSATAPARRQNNVLKLGFPCGCFYSFGLLSVCKQIKAQPVKCLGPGWAFKMHKGQAWTLIKKSFWPLWTGGGHCGGRKRPGISLPAPWGHKDVFAEESGPRRPPAVPESQTSLSWLTGLAKTVTGAWPRGLAEILALGRAEWGAAKKGILPRLTAVFTVSYVLQRAVVSGAMPPASWAGPERFNCPVETTIKFILVKTWNEAEFEFFSLVASCKQFT